MGTLSLYTLMNCKIDDDIYMAVDQPYPMRDTSMS